jgi:ATP-binding cassette, subfamily C, bacterial LapB
MMSLVPPITTLSLLRAAVGRRKGVLRDALLATFIVNVLALATSLFSMQVYDRVIPNSGFQTLYVLVAGVGLSILLELLLRHLRGVMLDREGTRIDAELSEWFFRRALGIRMEMRPPTLGTFAAQIKSLDLLKGVIASGPVFVLADVPFGLFFVGVIWMIGGPLAVIPLLMIPLSLFAGMAFWGRIQRETAASQGHSDQKSGTLVESIDAIESIKANDASVTMTERWRVLVDAAGGEDDRIKYWSELSGNLTQTLQQLGYVALIAYGAYLVTVGEMTMGGLIACSIIGSRALAPFGRLPSVLVQWAHAKAAVISLDRLIGHPNELDEMEHQLSPGALEGTLRMEGVRFFYGRNTRPALEVSALSVAAGERIGVIGTIGSGKSTFLKLVSGLWRANEGRVFLGGVDMAMIQPSRLHALVAYVPQDVRLIRGTLRENLVMGLPDMDDETLLGVMRETGLIDLLNGHSLGLSLPISEGGRGISGGQRQLIALTRLLLLQPRVLLLDEPTASMDAATEARVVALLGRMAANGTTLLVATHKTAVMPLLDRLLVFKEGRLVVDGPREQTLAMLAGKPPVPGLK